jgi:hypothetical protein
VAAKKELVSNWLQLHHRLPDAVLKRPMLPTTDSDDDGDLVTEALYDHHTVNEW